MPHTSQPPQLPPTALQLLNPDYSSQVQWRFVNRAIDEVENGSVPAVILIARNSTDTNYFQRLR